MSVCWWASNIWKADEVVDEGGLSESIEQTNYLRLGANDLGLPSMRRHLKCVIKCIKNSLARKPNNSIVEKAVSMADA